MKGSGIAEKIKKAMSFLNDNLELVEVKYTRMAIQRRLMSNTDINILVVAELSNLLSTSCDCDATESTLRFPQKKLILSCSLSKVVIHVEKIQ
jgi:hypothetical protein